MTFLKLGFSTVFQWFKILLYPLFSQDATANDIPKDKFDVSGYPTLFFVDATGKISLYEGKREKKDIISFIDSNKVEIPSNDTLESKVPTEEAPEDKKDELWRDFHWNFFFSAQYRKCYGFHFDLNFQWFFFFFCKSFGILGDSVEKNI